MLDVHVLLMHDTHPAAVQRCIDSIQEARQECSYPVSVWFLDGVVGHIGKGRAAGYSKGTSQYVTFVDDDDYVLPLSFDSLEEHMNRNVGAIYTGEYVKAGTKLTVAPHSRHHLCVHRRDLASQIDCTKYTWSAERAINLFVQESGEKIVDIYEPLYVRNVSGRSRYLRDAAPNELREIYRHG